MNCEHSEKNKFNEVEKIPEKKKLNASKIYIFEAKKKKFGDD